MRAALFVCLLPLWLVFAGSAKADSSTVLLSSCGSFNNQSGIAISSVDGAGRSCIGLYYSYSNLASNATTTIKSGSGVLHTVTINSKGASSNTLMLYDNTSGSGTVIATIDTTAGVQTLAYDLAFANGLTAVVGTGTAANLTVSYR